LNLLPELVKVNFKVPTHLSHLRRFRIIFGYICLLAQEYVAKCTYGRTRYVCIT
jgi:hypothetical protein